MNQNFLNFRSELLALENQPDHKARGLEEIKDDVLFSVEENSSSFPKGSENEKPRNVVLLFIDESGQDQAELWKSLKTNKFPVHGYLQVRKIFLSEKSFLKIWYYIY